MAQLSIQSVQEALRLDLETGHLYWLDRPRRHFRSDAGHRLFRACHAGRRADLSVYPSNGYLRVRMRIVDTKFDLLAHRLVFALVHGRWPQHEIDHIDRVRTNNVPGNLRDVPHIVNMQNLRPRDQKT